MTGVLELKNKKIISCVCACVCVSVPVSVSVNQRGRTLTPIMVARTGFEFARTVRSEKRRDIQSRVTGAFAHKDPYGRDLHPFRFQNYLN